MKWECRRCEGREPCVLDSDCSGIPYCCPVGKNPLWRAYDCTSELKPCPRCGSEYHLTVRYRYLFRVKIYRVRCRDCYLWWGDGSAVYGLTEKSVKNKWNRKWERHLRRSWRSE